MVADCKRCQDWPVIFISIKRQMLSLYRNVRHSREEPCLQTTNAAKVWLVFFISIRRQVLRLYRDD